MGFGSGGSGSGMGSGMGSVEASVVCAWPRRQAARAVADVPAALAAVLGVQRGQAGIRMGNLGALSAKCACGLEMSGVSEYVCVSE